MENNFCAGKDAIYRDLNDNFSKHSILAVDIGTTNLKCTLYDQNLENLSSSSFKLNVLQPKEGFSELEPDHLIETFKNCIQKCLEKKTEIYSVKSFGISTQRNSIIFWNKKTGKKYTNFILWNDTRPLDICNSMNSGVILNTLKKGAQCVTYVIPNHRLKAFSKYKIETSHIAPKLLSQLKILENKLDQVEFEQVLYGTIETWLLWTITKEKVFATDISCASCTGLYDMYLKKWSNLICFTLGIPMNKFPDVCDTCFNYGIVNNDFLNLNYDVSITALIADAQASVIAECAFDKGDVVITIGTGSFISVNIGNKPLSASNKIYSIACFKKLEKEIFIFHSGVSSSGIAIDWAKSIGLFNEYNEIENLLTSVENSNGCYFVSAFGFLECIGIEKTKLGTGFIGIKSNTSKAHMLRSIIDSLAFAIKIRMDLIIKEMKNNDIPLRSIRISGGVSRSNFFCQYLSNLLEFQIERSESSYTSSTYGAAFLAGLGSKLWNNVEDLKKFRKNVKIFTPSNNENSQNYENDLNQWKSALEKFADWYKPT